MNTRMNTRMNILKACTLAFFVVSANCAMVEQTDLDEQLADAVLTDDLKTAQELIARGADVNQPNANGEVLLHQVQNPALATALITAGANVNAQDNAGRTPLHRAVSKGLYDVTRTLIGAGANVNARDNRGNIVLNYALHPYNPTPLVQLLLDRGADVTPSDLLIKALALANPDLVKLAIAKGALVTQERMKLAKEQAEEAEQMQNIPRRQRLEAIDRIFKCYLKIAEGLGVTKGGMFSKTKLPLPPEVQTEIARQVAKEC